MAKKKKFGTLLEQQSKKIPVVQQKAPKTLATNVHTGGIKSATNIASKSPAKTARQKAEEDRSNRMRSGLSSVVRSSFNRQMSRPTYVNKSTLNRFNQINKAVTNPLAPTKNNNVTGGRGTGEQKLFSKQLANLNKAKFVTGGQGVGGRTVTYSPIGNGMDSVLAPMKETADYTRSQQSKYLNTDLQRKGLNTPAAQLMAGKTTVGVEQGKALRAGMPTNSNFIESWRPTSSMVEKVYRDRYGSGEDFSQKQITERLDNSGVNRDKVAAPKRVQAMHGSDDLMQAKEFTPLTWDDVRSGFADAWALKNPEDTLERQYGRTVDDATREQLEAQRSTGGYAAGMMAGQMAQYGLTRGALTGLGIVGRGAKAADTAGKAFRSEMIIDQAASVPLNLIDAMKEDNLEGIVKRFGLNQGLDLFFGGVTEGISIKRNPLYRNAETKHIAANEARNAGDNATANALDQSARRDLNAIPKEELDNAQEEIRMRMRQYVEDEFINPMNERAQNFADNQVPVVREGYVASSEAAMSSRVAQVPDNQRYEWELAYDEARRRGYTQEEAFDIADASLEDAINRGNVRQSPAAQQRARAEDFNRNAERSMQDGYVASNEAVQESLLHDIPEEQRYEWQTAYDEIRRQGETRENAIEYADASLEEAIRRNSVRQSPNAVERSAETASDRLARLNNERENALANVASEREDPLLAARNARQEDNGLVGNDRLSTAERGEYGKEVTQRYNRAIDLQKQADEAEANVDRVLREYDSPIGDGMSAEDNEIWDSAYREAREKYNGFPDAEQRAIADADAAVMNQRGIRLAEAVNRSNEARDAARQADRNTTGSNREKIKEAKRFAKERTPAKAESKVEPKAKAIADKKAAEKKAKEAAKSVAEEIPERPKNESIYDATKRFLKNWSNDTTREAYRLLTGRYGKMSVKELEGEKTALRNAAKNFELDPEEAADRIAVIDAIIREKNGASVKAPNAESSTASVDRSKEAWGEIPNITGGEQKPKDLMRQKPHRNENQIPKHSEQKVKEQVFYRGDGIGNKNARETAEQTAQGAVQQEPKRVVNSTAKRERPKTDYSEMSLHDLQAERHSLEEQVRYDKTGRVDNKIYEIDEEFKRRGEEPNWFAVEPEEGGKRVRSPREQDAEVERLKKKYGEFKNGLNKKIETDEGVRRNLKTLDTILPEASPEVDHIVTNNMLDGKYAIDDGRTTKDILTEVKANMAENPEAYTNKIANFDETVDARERIVALETAQAYWKEVGNTEYELKATEALSKYVSESASILKIHGILRKLSKPARMDYLDQTIARLEKRFEKRLKRAKIEHIRVSDETREMLKKAKTDEQTKEAWTRASLEIWNQIPASVKEKMDFIRVNAMLLNPKTHIRNFLGNAIFLPLREAKNITGTGLEYLAMKAGILDPSNRTKAIIPYKEGMDYADTVLKDMGDELRGANRYFEDIANDRPFDVDVFMAGRQNGNPFINGIRKATDKIGNFNAWALEHEDFLFFNGAFKEHFGRVMKARKLTVKDLENNPALRNDIIETATEEALRATYRDESAAARIISRWKNPGEKAHITRKIIGVALDAILPFTKTPINILRRAIDYSPLGFPKGAFNFLSGWHSGNQKQVVKGLDQLASAIPGSGLAILGWFMAERDGVTGNLGAEKDDQFMRDLGKQKFSVVFHSGTDKEWSYTLDWAAPGCIPFFTGVAYKEWSDGSFDFWEVADTFEKMFEPTMEMSVMQGIKNTAETFQRASDGGVWQGLFSVGVNTGLQYAGQFKPTLVSQTARFIDPVRRDTTSTADTALQRQVERWWNKQKAGIPSTPLTNNSLYNISSKSLNPYQNVWGDEENNTYNDNTAMRAIENFLSPGYAKKYKADDVDKEILSIYKQDPSAEGVIPTKFSKYEIGFDGGTVRFSNDDRANFIKVQGKVSKQDLRKIFDSEEYNNASLTNKQKMIANAYADAKGEAKRDTLLKMGKDEWKVYTDDFDDDSRKKDYSDAKDAGLKADQYYELMTTKDWDLDESGKPVKSELAMYLNDQDLTDAQRAVIFSKLANSNTKNPYEDGTAHTTDWQSEYDNYLAKKNKGSSGSSGSSGSKKRRSGRSGSSGGGSKKARAKTDSEKRFAALQTGKAPTNAKGIEALSSVKGLSKSQKKALLKLLKKRLEV